MKKTLIITSILLLLVSVCALPMDASAKTIQQFEEEVQRYTQDLENKRANLARNDSEIAAIEKRIKEIQGQIEEGEKEVERLQQEIEESEAEIKRKSEESKSIISYYQISNGENAYLEYAFGATDITDMIYRLSVVEQLTEYNDKVMKELDELIKKNQARQQELEAKKKELQQLEKDLEKEIARIEIDSSIIKESMPSVEAQIKAARDSVAYYKQLGCGATEDIQACEYRKAQESGSSLPSVGFFQRPISNGYMIRGKGGGHLGVDVSSNNKTIPVYPIATGVVHKMYYDSCTSDTWCRRMGAWCNGNARIIVIKHNYNGQFIYSSYVHLSGYGDVREGSFVTQNTVIGYMGNTGCSTAAHLHLEVGKCFWMNGGCNYDTYKSRLMDPSGLVTFPGSWNNR